MTVIERPLVETVRRPLGGGRRLATPQWIAAAPFFLYVGIFMLLPTAIVVGGAFVDSKGFSLSNFATMNQRFVINAFINSVVLSMTSAIIGAIFGALLAYAVATGNPNGVFRRLVSSACGVLAQFGGVTLAFAFIATIGGAGFITLWLQQHGMNIYANGVWLYQLRGLVLVYTYFQIPLMVLVFLPALDGIRPPLSGRDRHVRQVGPVGPLLRRLPCFRLHRARSEHQGGELMRPAVRPAARPIGSESGCNANANGGG